MQSFSYWEKTSFFSGIDVAIIGSGIVGLSTAIFLKQKSPGLSISIFERGTLPSGASTKNAGFACFGSMTELLDDMKERNGNSVFELVEKRWKGLNTLRQLLGDDAIHYQEKGGFEVFLEKDEDIFSECLQRMEYFNQNLKDIIGTKNVFQVRDDLISKFGFQKTGHLILNKAEGQIDTGRMMRSLISTAKKMGIEIWNGLKIQKLDESGKNSRLWVSENHFVEAKKTLVATNGFAAQLISELDLKPARNQVIITEPIHSLPFEGCFHLDRGYYYFRSVDIRNSSAKRILFGGGRNLAAQEETTASFGQTEVIQSALEKKLREIIYPKRKLKLEMRWSGILGVGKTKEPILRKISPSIYVAVRLGGMGVAIGSLLGKRASDTLLEDF